MHISAYACIFSHRPLPTARGSACGVFPFRMRPPKLSAAGFKSWLSRGWRKRKARVVNREYGRSKQEMQTEARVRKTGSMEEAGTRFRKVEGMGKPSSTAVGFLEVSGSNVRHWHVGLGSTLGPLWFASWCVNPSQYHLLVGSAFKKRPHAKLRRHVVIFMPWANWHRPLSVIKLLHTHQ